MDYDAVIEQMSLSANQQFKGVFNMVRTLDKEQAISFQELMLVIINLRDEAYIRAYANYWNAIVTAYLLDNFGITPWDEKIDFQEDDFKTEEL